MVICFPCIWLGFYRSLKILLVTPLVLLWPNSSLSFTKCRCNTSPWMEGMCRDTPRLLWGGKSIERWRVHSHGPASVFFLKYVSLLLCLYFDLCPFNTIDNKQLLWLSLWKSSFLSPMGWQFVFMWFWRPQSCHLSPLDLQIAIPAFSQQWEFSTFIPVKERKTNFTHFSCPSQAEM